MDIQAKYEDFWWTIHGAVRRETLISVNYFCVYPGPHEGELSGGAEKDGKPLPLCAKHMKDAMADPNITFTPLMA